MAQESVEQVSGSQMHGTPRPGTLAYHIMKLPAEVRSQIFSELCVPFNSVTSGETTIHQQWYPDDSLLPREISSEGVRAYYGGKKLILEFPELTRGPAGQEYRQVYWPSALLMHDTDHEFFLELGATARNEYHGLVQLRGFVGLSTILDCPFQLYSSITIKIPPYRDSLGLVVNWSRLRLIGHILSENFLMPQRFKGADRPPQVNIVYEDNESWSWFDEDNNPKLSPEFSESLRLDGLDSPVSDMVILLRALSPIRDLASIKIQLPDGFPRSEFERMFSAAWFVAPESWEDRLTGSMDKHIVLWLKLCEKAMSAYLEELGILSYPIPHCLRIEGTSDLTPAAPLPYLPGGSGEEGSYPEWVSLFSRSVSSDWLHEQNRWQNPR